MDMYGMAERVAFATGCEVGNMHLNSDYSFVEIVDDQGQPTTEEGFVVGTTFHNDVMPLVRYRLSDGPDFAGPVRVRTHIPIDRAGDGQYEDAVFNKHGNPVSPSVLTFAFKGVKNIAKSQVAQVADGVWQIRIVPMPGYTKSDEEKLVKNIHRLVDADVDLEAVVRNNIPNTSTGKFRWVVNETIR